MITLEHTGACMIAFKGSYYFFGDTFEVEEISEGIKHLIADGKLTIVSDRKLEKQVKEEIKAKVKPKAAKTLDEVQVGKEYK